MMKKRVICVLGILLGTLRAFPAIAAEPAHVYQYYLNAGIKAFGQHEDEEAARYLSWAHQLDPSAEEPSRYIDMLNARQQAAATPKSFAPYFEELMRKGKAALAGKNYESAADHFYTAHLFDRDSEEPLKYLQMVKQAREDASPIVDREGAVTAALDKFQPRAGPVAVNAPVKAAPTASVAMGPPVARLPSVPSLSKKTAGSADVIELSDILAASQGGRASIKLQTGTSVIIEGKNIQRFLVLDETAILARKVTRDQLQVESRRWGGTFLHIWDESTGALARHTVYIDVVLPQPEGGVLKQSATVEHAEPFRLRYSTDWGSYYRGNTATYLRRQSLSSQQNFGMEGETPYGFFDASASTVGLQPLVNVVAYTVGLSGIPAPAVTNFNIRLFDVNGALTPLTLPGSPLRGVSAGANVLDNKVGLYAVHGQQESTFGFYSFGTGTMKDVEIDAGRVTLFPGDPQKHYAFNYAAASGAGRDPLLTKDVYSVSGTQKLAAVTLDGELARDDRTTASLAGAQWDGGIFRTGVKFRDINKDFTTVTSSASNQGDIGAVWTTDTDLPKAGITTSVEAYRNRVIFNPDRPQAYNYDTSAGVNVPINETYSLNTNVNYTDTPGDISPRQYVSGMSRVTRSFGVWHGRRGSGYAGVSGQRNRYQVASASDYDRAGVLTGVQLPLTPDLAWTANYEISRLHEPYSGMDYQPNVLTTGLTLNRKLTAKLNGSFGLSYRKEEGAGGGNSFLSGEDSVDGSVGLTYNQSSDVSLFFDGRSRDAWGKVTGSPSYNDLDLRLGMRAAWGTPVRWDPAGVVEGIVFKDKDGNGRYDRSDEGVPDVKVKVGDNETVTDAHGWYHMDVRAKRVAVTPVMENLPTGFVFSTPALARVDVRQGLRQRADFGLRMESGIFGVVFVDKNGNNTPDAGDELVGRVKVILDGKLSQVSGGQGAYFFKNVPAGAHVITLDMVTMPQDVIPLVKLRNGINITEGTTYTFHIPVKRKVAATSSENQGRS